MRDLLAQDKSTLQARRSSRRWSEIRIELRRRFIDREFYGRLSTDMIAGSAGVAAVCTLGEGRKSREMTGGKNHIERVGTLPQPVKRSFSNIGYDESMRRAREIVPIPRARSARRRCADADPRERATSL
jgi:hypothetical protein